MPETGSRDPDSHQHRQSCRPISREYHPLTQSQAFEIYLGDLITRGLRQYHIQPTRQDGLDG